MRFFSFIIIAFIIGLGCIPDTVTGKKTISPQKVENLRTFAKLYGYVRYFHPSDEASAVDWNKFTVFGIEKVLAAKDELALRQALQNLFLPLAPTIQIYFTQEGPVEVSPPSREEGQVLVTWQHHGIGFGSERSAYQSVRLGRTGISSRPSDGFKWGSQDQQELNEDPGALFSTHATTADVVTKELGCGLSCRIPLALYLPAEPPVVFLPAFNQITTQLDQLQVEDTSALKEATRIGAVIQAWNVFNHFYPYFDVVQTDWDNVLTVTLTNVLTNKNTEDCLYTLRQLVAALQDGHGRVNHPIESNMKPLPAVFDWVEDKIVVLASTSDKLKKGDILVEYDGMDAVQRFLNWELLSSGTPQLRKTRALRNFTLEDSTLLSELLIDRGGKLKTVSLGRNLPKAEYERPEAVSKLTEDIYYVNLDKASVDEIKAKMSEIAASKGVIFDLRGYPKGNEFVIKHMIDAPVQSAKWNIPQIIYPDMQQVAGYDTSGRWLLKPEKPRIKGKIVFLTNGTAISYAESCMGIIEHYHLATIIGSPTAGANGNVNPFKTIGGFSFSWTGMKVLKNDGSQHHLIGIHPDILVYPTIKGIREGRDEVLEKGLAFIRK